MCNYVYTYAFLNTHCSLFSLYSINVYMFLSMIINPWKNYWCYLPWEKIVSLASNFPLLLLLLCLGLTPDGLFLSILSHIPFFIICLSDYVNETLWFYIPIWFGNNLIANFLLLWFFTTFPFHFLQSSMSLGCGRDLRFCELVLVSTYLSLCICELVLVSTYLSWNGCCLL